MPGIEETIEFMRKAHGGQVDKGGAPYYEHPLRVMMRLGEGATLAEKIAALLHDVLEDTGFGAEELKRRGYSEEIIEIVRLVSENHFPGLTYLQHIRALVGIGNLSAMKVKLADIADNMAPSRVAILPGELTYLVGRYGKAKKILAAALGEEVSGEIIWGDMPVDP